MHPHGEMCGHGSHQSSSPGQHAFVPVFERMLQGCLPREHLPSPLHSLGQAPHHRRGWSSHQLAEPPCAHNGSLFSPGAGEKMPGRACTEAALLVLPGLQPLFGLDGSAGAETWPAPPRLHLCSRERRRKASQCTSSCREPLPHACCSFSLCPCFSTCGYSPICSDSAPCLDSWSWAMCPCGGAPAGCSRPEAHVVEQLLVQTRESLRQGSIVGWET